MSGFSERFGGDESVLRYGYVRDGTVASFDAKPGFGRELEGAKEEVAEHVGVADDDVVLVGAVVVVNSERIVVSVEICLVARQRPLKVAPERCLQPGAVPEDDGGMLRRPGNRLRRHSILELRIFKSWQFSARDLAGEAFAAGPGSEVDAANSSTAASSHLPHSSSRRLRVAFAELNQNYVPDASRLVGSRKAVGVELAVVPVRIPVRILEARLEDLQLVRRVGGSRQAPIHCRALLASLLAQRQTGNRH